MSFCIFFLIIFSDVLDHNSAQKKNIIFKHDEKEKMVITGDAEG